MTWTYVSTIVGIGKVTVALNPSPPMPLEQTRNVLYFRI